MNNLKDIESNLRYIAKKNKFIKYTAGTVVAFLIMGYSAFSEEVMSRKEIGSKAKNLYSTVQKAKKENDKKIKNAKLELIQLMEQADQVAKSPWASWQFGLNYMYDDYHGEYKGRGDKEEKYPYEGIFKRSSNVFVRNVTDDEKKREEVEKILKSLGEYDPGNNHSAINNNRIGRYNAYGLYGLVDREIIQEIPYEIQIAATIYPKSIDKQPPNVEVGEVNIEKLNPVAAPTPPSEPTPPKIYIPGFSPIAPNVTPPTLPVPPTFAVVLGADCNSGTTIGNDNICSNGSNSQGYTKTVEGFLNSPKNKSKQNVRVFRHYTWTDSDVPEAGAKGLAFKMWHSNYGMRENIDADKIYFNSYNFDKDGKVEFSKAILKDGNYAHYKNGQYFLVGGSRFIEIDQGKIGKILPGKTVNLGGVLTLALVSQGNSGKIINEGTITDMEEKDEEWIKQMPTDPGKDYLTIIGPTEEYHIKRSADGYVGYKVGIALVQEDSPGSSQVFSNAESGVIDFRGKRSIGMYTYLPTKRTAVRPLENKGQILLSGEEGYGMKLASHTSNDAGMINTGTITLRKNPDGVDKADNSAAMALMVDTSVEYKVNLADGKAVNTETGTINLQDNIENAIGMYVNIDSNMTNNGIINISAKSDGGPNSGMRADQVDAANATHSEAYNTTVINAKTINITGKNGIGMIANGKTDKGTAKALSSGTITITGGETNYGLFANDEATAENTGTITIKDSKNSIGMASLYDQANSKTSTAINNGQIVVNSANSTGVYNTGIFNMNNQNATVSVDGNQSIGVYATGANSKTTLSAGTINVKHSGVGLYSDNSIITLDNTSNNLKLEADEGGLLFYNYESANPLISSGKFKLKGNVKAEIKDKGYAFYIKGAKVTEHGGITGVTEFLNSMFGPSASGQKLNIDLKTGGTLMILDKPTGTAMNLSTVSTLQNLNSSLGDRVDLAATEDGSKIFSVYRGKLDIDQNVNLDEPTDDIYKLDFLSSSITNLEGQTITGTKEGQLAMFQANYDEGAGGKGAVDEINVINKGKIVLTGNSNTSKTTTAMAGDFITLTNSGDIEIAANKTIGMFGSGGSIVENSGNILVGEEGTALFGVNKLGDSSLGDNHISLTNSGTIKVVDGHTKAFGIYANNDINTFTTLTSADSVLTNSGTIDLSNASQSMGIGAKNSTIVNSGKILLGDKGVAINSEYSNINSSGDIELGANGIAFNLDKIKATDKFNLTSKVKLNGNGSSIINITDSEFNTSSTNVIEDLKIQRKSNDDKYNYYSINNSKLVNTQAKTLTGNNIIMVNSTTSEVDWQGNVTMIGNKNIAFYATGVKTDPEIKVSNGVIKLDGESSIGMYAENSARIENSSEVSVGKKGIGIYAKSANSKVTNNGNMALLEDGTGIFLEEINGVNFSNIGKISSDSKNAKGIVFKNATSNAFENSGEINLTGPISIGVYSEGAAHTFTNKGKIAVGSTLPNVSQSVGVYAADNGIIVNEGEINAGNGSIGIFGHKIITKTGSSVTVKDGAIGIYSEGDGIDLQAGSKMKIGNDDAVAIYYNGNNGTIKNSLSSLEMGKNSMGLVVSGNNNIVTNNLSKVELKGDSIYTYSTDKAGTVNGNTNIIAKADNNYGYYTAGNLNNTGDIDFSQGIGNIGIYSITDSGATGIAKNSGRILVGKSDIENNFYSIGMAAGYYKRDKNTGVVTEKQGHIVNTGDIIVNDSNSIGMYAAGQGSKAINQGTITVKARKGIGMFITDKAYGENALGGKIILEVGADNSVGVYVAKKSVFKNYGEIIIKANNSKGIIHSSDSTVDAGTITDNGTGNTKVHAVSNPGGNKEFGNLEFVVEPNFVGPTKVLVNGKIVTPTKIDTTSINPDAAVDSAGLDIPYNENPYFNMQNLGAASAIGMYVDTSGINFTNPIQGLQYLQGLKNVDLIIGSEAAEYTNSKVVEIGENILERYNKEILNNPQIEKWNVVSGALTWAAAPGEYDSNKGFKNIVMAKIDYREFSKDDKNLYNFLDGLEQRYDKNSLDSKEKKLFNKINNIGKNEEVLFTQAIDEMMGHPYSNVQQRVYETGRILDREFKYLRDEWDTVSKDSNKIKAFGMRREYKTDTAGIIDYKNKAEGVAYLNENETVKLGESIGWYTGFVHNEFKFKDIGKSEEEVFEGKLGVYKSIPFDHNNGLNWTISGETFLGKNKMNRRYLVVDEIFNAKSRYWTYGAAINNELTKTHRLSEDFFFDYYGGLKLEYGRFTDIREKSGEMRLEVDGNDYFSVKPEIGTGLKYKHQLGEGEISLKTNVAYEVELGEVNKAQNKARVGYTSAGWYDLPKEKEDKNGNVKLDLNVGYSNESYGVTANIGYDTENKNTRYGVGFRIIF